MKSSIRQKLEHLSERLTELDQLLGDENATRDIDHYRKLSCEHAEVGDVVALFQRFRQCEDDLLEAERLLADPEMKALAEEEMPRLLSELEYLETALQKALLPVDERPAQPLSRNPGGHGRRRIGPVRRRPFPHVHPLCRAATLAGGADFGQ